MRRTRTLPVSLSTSTSTPHAEKNQNAAALPFPVLGLNPPSVLKQQPPNMLPTDDPKRAVKISGIDSRLLGTPHTHTAPSRSSKSSIRASSFFAPTSSN